MLKIKPLLAALGAIAFAAPVLACDGAKGEAKAAARTAAFQEADANGDGALSAQEFQVFHDAMKQQMEAQRFARLDANGDGQVTAEELQNGRPHKGNQGNN